MNDKDKIYLASLLHDIGKFIERAENHEWKKKAEKFLNTEEVSPNCAHRRYSAVFIEEFLSDSIFNNDISAKNSVLKLVLHHHNDDPNTKNFLSIDQRGYLQQIIRIADDLASSEREIDETLNAEYYYLVNLESPFNDVQIEIDSEIKKLEKDEKKYLIPAILSLSGESQFPVEYNKVEKQTNKYPELVEKFLTEVKKIESQSALLSLMEKYLIHVPAQTPTEIEREKNLYKPDLNLYDHSRTVAAIAVALYEEFENGAYSKLKQQLITKNKEYLNQLSEIGKPAILLCGNVNGIQDFIFDVKSERAAKSLKGRSYFIQLLTEVVAKFIVDKWGLKDANILYDGGGNFFILAPNFRKENVREIQKNIAENLIEAKLYHLYFSLGFTEVTFDDFANFGNAFDRAVKNSNQAKKQKFKEFSFEKIFSPFSQISKGEKKFDELTITLQKPTTHYYIGADFPSDKNRPKWEELFRKFGYQVSFRSVVEIKKQGKLFNSLDFSEDYEGFKFSVKDLPLWNNELKEKFQNNYGDEEFRFDENDGEKFNSIVSFKRLAELAKFDTGTEKLGILKMDIDNLGQIFKDGLKKPTIGRVAFLSRSLKWFFEGYMNTLLNKETYKYYIYPIFSGGDDFFIVGAWNKVFEFAFEIREKFKKFVGGHPGISLSASLLVLDESYPVKQMARIAEERLESAKDRRSIKTNAKIKDALSVFDTVMSWDDFLEAKLLKEKIVEIIRLTGNNRSIINKIQKSSVGFASIQKDALFGKVIKLYKVWRLNYYLRDFVNVSGKNPHKETIEKTTNEIVKQYENLFFGALKGEATSIQIFPVAARWAELETRNKIGDKKDE